jgi:hypothetical protein
MPKLKTVKPARDHVAFEPVMLAVSKARAARHLLLSVDNPDMPWDQVVPISREKSEPLGEHLDWIRDFAFDALHEALDEIELEYRKLGTNLLQKEVQSTDQAGAGYKSGEET